MVPLSILFGLGVFPSLGGLFFIGLSAIFYVFVLCQYIAIIAVSIYCFYGS